MRPPRGIAAEELVGALAGLADDDIVLAARVRRRSTAAPRPDRRSARPGGAPSRGRNASRSSSETMRSWCSAPISSGHKPRVWQLARVRSVVGVVADRERLAPARARPPRKAPRSSTSRCLPRGRFRRGLRSSSAARPTCAAREDARATRRQTPDSGSTPSQGSHQSACRSCRPRRYAATIPAPASSPPRRT